MIGDVQVSDTTDDDSSNAAGTINKMIIYTMFTVTINLCFTAIVSIIFVFMKVTEKMVDDLAHLAMLQFTEAEKAALKEDMQKMISFVEKLKEVNTDGVEPLLHISKQANVLREDEVKASISREDALLNAPLKDALFFKVPKVIKK